MCRKTQQPPSPSSLLDALPPPKSQQECPQATALSCLLYLHPLAIPPSSSTTLLSSDPHPPVNSSPRKRKRNRPSSFLSSLFFPRHYRRIKPALGLITQHPAKRAGVVPVVCPPPSASTSPPPVCLSLCVAVSVCRSRRRRWACSARRPRCTSRPPTWTSAQAATSSTSAPMSKVCCPLVLENSRCPELSRSISSRRESVILLI